VGLHGLSKPIIGLLHVSVNYFKNKGSDTYLRSLHYSCNKLASIQRVDFQFSKQPTWRLSRMPVQTVKTIACSSEEYVECKNLRLQTAWLLYGLFLKCYQRWFCAKRTFWNSAGHVFLLALPPFTNFTIVQKCCHKKDLILNLDQTFLLGNTVKVRLGKVVYSVWPV
jgi:hypothetical protein